MTQRTVIRLTSCGCRLGFVLFCLVLSPGGASAQVSSNQVLNNLQYLVQRLSIGHPANPDVAAGPKEIASVDFDQDTHPDLATANTNGFVTVFFGQGGGKFTNAIHLASGAGSLRDIAVADWNGDGRPDLAVAGPFTRQIVVFTNLGPRSRSFAGTAYDAWPGVRNLAAGDFDGDGRADLVAAGPNNGLRQYRSSPDGFLTETNNITAVSVETPDTSLLFPKPVYSMKAFRPEGSSKDHLVLTHADTNRIWLLMANAEGLLEVRSFITNRADSHGLEIGPLLHAHSNGPPDLITVQRDAGALEIHAGIGTATDFAFSQDVRQRIDVPGGPRAVAIVDLNSDGWNDLVVVVRNFDTVLTYANSNGVFSLAAERPVGSSPRALVTGFFDDDEFPDLAAMNHDSSDLSLLMASPNKVGYRGVNHLYLVDGNVAGLTVQDFNGDGRPDVIQLHRASGDFSVRLTNPDGTLQAPVFYTVGNVPSAQVLAFANNDSIPDLITANLGTTGIEEGSVTVRLGNGDGTFGTNRQFQLGPDPDGRFVHGRLFALVPADFDRDGNIDLAAGFLDSRVAFLRGSQDGSFEYVGTQPFVNQARGIVAADCDKDGDIDLACVGVSGEMWVVENPGRANTATNLMKVAHFTNYVHRYLLPPGADSFGGRRIIALDYDHDSNSNIDLVIGSGKGAWLYLNLGQSGIGFEPPRLLGDTTHFMSDLVMADLDNDGRDDLVISCRGKDCLKVFTRPDNPFFGSGFPADAPASKFIAVGDLDGDGTNDLVGTGRVLWTSLSGHPPTDTPPLQLAGQRQRLTNAVINEILAINTALPLQDDPRDSDLHSVDWVEIYNGSPLALTPGGWKLLAAGPNENGIRQTNVFNFPPFSIPSMSRRLIYFSDLKPGEIRPTLYHTGFPLSGDGGTLELYNGASNLVDRVEYPPQRPNISYARFRDGLPAFAFNPFPSDGRPNVFNGQLEPDLKFSGVNPATFRPGVDSQFVADVKADVGASVLTMYYQFLNFPETGTQPLQFYDDGQHGDGGVSDGCFAGLLEGGFFPGDEVQFFFEVTDLNDQVIQVPEEPEFGLAGEPGNTYQLALVTNLPSLEISEFVARNVTGLHDETNGTPDWVEVRNIGPVPVPLHDESHDIVLTQQLGDNSRYHFPFGTVLAPGEHFVVYCDNRPDQGPLHSPFRLSRSGDTIMLTGLTTNNSRTLIDWVSFGPQAPDVAWARLGASGAWRMSTPTPRSANIPADWLGLVETDGTGTVFTFAFPTAPNTTYVVEHAPNLGAGSNWSVLQTIAGDGIEKVIRRPLEGSGFFRVRKAP